MVCVREKIRNKKVKIHKNNQLTLSKLLKLVKADLLTFYVQCAVKLENVA